MKRRIFLLFGAAAAVAVIALALLWHPSTGIDVTVLNRGPGVITDVEVQVKGHGFPLGPLAPGASATGRLVPAGESDIAVEFRDAEEMWHAVKADVYLERGYHGKVTVELERNAISRVEHHVGPESQ